mmetsp:Transcript_22931/g.58550  ORF Transcript_22931/g.58550 Transcript_22931/m.58550 type:complete len:305 (-) Transcript_22931:609-1523(-)|eukprot:CAMPEP_0202861656 /NCGR_PEP_ID=MMETSP1391-20130828/2980_1 /ASSEMBLY_ACC=CAM_ASM_000867 /TAXON_ID=1034604 /ORGANISM="Chlamydomonas leiostraca, Strain SAG 11-49" /LENGTH=304 /DNA_ID=CAMNT_0049541077 /DNA_START=177 /DNA_END=1091 /DNA_ORIENTATION=+
MPYNFDGPNDLYGTFNEEKSVYIGDPYQQHKYELSRHKGKTFNVPFQPKGKGPDAMIDKTTKLTIAGDTYIDPYSLQKDLSKRSSIHAKAFVPVGGTKKMAGSGSLYGIFGPPRELLDTDASLGAKSGRPASSPVAGKRNIYVAPQKKGSFGFPWQDRSIGGTRFEFIPDEYQRGRILEREMKREARAKIAKPFVSMGRTGKGIVPLSPTMPAEPPPPRPPKDNSIKKAWKAPNPPQKGVGYGTISKIEYVPVGPNDAKYDKDAPKPKAFKPVGGIHNRLSMRAVNPYQYAARPPPDNDLSLLG